MSRMAVIEGNEIKYHVMDPTGNITILVETPVDEASQPFIASELMRIEPDAEQVGFLGDDQFCDIALRMAGGEFCGNATMSAAAFLAARTGMQEGTVTVRVSGAAEPVPVEICIEFGTETGKRQPDSSMYRYHSYRGTVTMPQPVSISEVKLPVPDMDSSNPAAAAAGGSADADHTAGNKKSPEREDFRYHTYPVVHFEGIDHVILEEKNKRFETDQGERNLAEQLAPVWCRELRAEAVGLMFLNRVNNSMTPLVYVPEAGTLVWENSCASGTSAVGAWAAAEAQQKDDSTGETGQEGGGIHSLRTVSMSLQEPGGKLSVEVSPDGTIRLTGTVREWRG